MLYSNGENTHGATVTLFGLTVIAAMLVVVAYRHTSVCLWNDAWSANKTWHMIVSFHTSTHSMFTITTPQTRSVCWQHCTSCIRTHDSRRTFYIITYIPP